MSILARAESKQYELPNKGLVQAVLADIVGPFEEDTEWGVKDKVRFIFQIAQKQTEGNFAGERFRVVKKYTLSLHEKSNLSQDLESWFGKSIPNDTRNEGIDLETLIGRHAGIVIVHKDGENGRTYANISTIIPPDPGNDLTVSEDFVRDKDRAQDTTSTAPSSQGAASTEPDPWGQPAKQQAQQQAAQQAQTPAGVPIDGEAGTMEPDDDLPF